MAASSSDHNVTETALDAVKCKLSAATQGYFRDDFLQLFVDKPTRRIPLIHRGYYLRHVAIANRVDAFLNQYGSEPVNIVSLGAGFDTLLFRMIQSGSARNVNFVEVDCASIVAAKASTLRDRLSAFFPEDAVVDDDGSVGVESSVAFRYRIATSKTTAKYAMLACDLGDTTTLERGLKALEVDTTRPTLVIAECVVSYLEPERGTELLRWAASAFSNATAVLYDPIALNDTFGATLQRYFSVKGCSLLSLREFQTANDHFRRFLTLTGWKTCTIMDMNAVYRQLTSRDEKQRLPTLEPFDELTDWWIFNSHYAVIVATNNESGSIVLVRPFQQPDLTRVQELFRSTHLEFAVRSKAVRKFVEKRLQSPDGDMSDIASSFSSGGTCNRHGFWVAEVGGHVIGCIGVKPSTSTPTAAELCRLSVDPTFRRRGVASALVSTLEQFVRGDDTGYQSIVLETIGALAAAQDLYRAHGYTQTTTTAFASFELVAFEKVFNKSELSATKVDNSQ